MKYLHQELRRAREQAGLSQQALADKAGIPRNQIVRAERGENITIETLRKIAAYLPVTELTLIDTTGLRVDVIPQPEKLFFAALESVIRLADALGGAILLALEAGSVVEAARRAAPPLPGGPERSANVLALPLRSLQRILGEIEEFSRDVRIA